MSWIKNIILVLFSVTFTLAIAEIFLLIDGRYYDQVSLQIKEVNTKKIWSREKNSKDTRKHPDLGYEIDIVFDEKGARKSDFVMEKKEAIVGVFGDSFAENRRIENEYTFTEILNGVNKSTHFVNFGVDGYSLEQSFQHWIDKKSLIEMDIVFYLFCSNDFEDNYLSQIFNREEMTRGRAINQADIDIPFLVIIASKFHLTYLFIESYYKFKSIAISQDKLINQLARRFTLANVDFRNRQFNEVVNDLTKDLLEDKPNSITNSEALHFKLTLQEWKRQVENNGGKFIVLILPREIDSIVSKKLIPENINSINLAEYNVPKVTKETSWNFSADGHWNEYGNLLAAISLSQLLTELEYIKPYGQVIDNVDWNNYYDKIDMLYEDNLSN